MSAAAAQAPIQDASLPQPSRRKFFRHPLNIPLDVTVLRSGVPETIPARVVDLCEGGLSAILAGELQSGQAVGVEFILPTPSEFVRVKAVVRHQAELCCGLEFISLASHQQEYIQSWLQHTAQPNTKVAANAVPQNANLPSGILLTGPLHIDNKAAKPTTKIKIPAKARFLAIVLLSICLCALISATAWQQWQGAWKSLETQIPVAASAAGQAPMAVSPEIMQSRLIHKVDPVYPEQARQANIQGVVMLHVIVAKDGSVLRVDSAGRNDALAQAAIDAVKWWRFEPYTIKGKAAPVETTISVVFQP